VKTFSREEQSSVRKRAAGERHNMLKAASLALILAGSLACIHFSPLGYYIHASNMDRLKNRLLEFHALAPIVFSLGGAFIITLGAPRSVISVLGGMVFGFFCGLLLSLMASLLGSVVIFSLTKWLGRPLFQQKVGHYLKAIEDHVQSNGFLIVVLLRQLPLTCLLVNVLIGLTSVSTGIFFLGSIAGLLPEAAIFSLFGSSVWEHFILRVSLASFLLVFLALAIRIYYNRFPVAKKIYQSLSGQ